MMKKIKLLTSITALLFVLSTTGCTVEDDSPLDVVNSESSESSQSNITSEDSGNIDDTTSEPSTQDEPHSGYYGFTLVFTFTDSDGNDIGLPDNATAYILGGWDNWATYTPLTYNDGYYCMTFDKIETGTYRYRVVMWFSDENVSWLNCVEITEENQTLRIRTDYTDYYTLNISLVLDVSLPTEEERVNRTNDLTSSLKILNVASSIGCLSNLWDGVHIEALLGNRDYQYDVCLNPNSLSFGEYWGVDGYEQFFVYGTSYYTIPENDYTYYSYYNDGLVYKYRRPNSNVNGGGVAVEFCEFTTFEELIEDYSKPLIDAGELTNQINRGVDTNGNATHYSLTTEGNEYILVVNSDADGVYTYRCTSDLDFTYFSFDNNDDTSFEVTSTTLNEVEEKVDLLRASFSFCIEPMDVFKKVYNNYNYSIDFEFTEMITDDYVTYKEYNEASDSEKYEIIMELEENFELIEESMYVFYTEDAVYIEKGYSYDDGKEVLSSGPKRVPIFVSNYGILLVNSTTDEGDYMSVYFTDDNGATWQLGSFTDYAGVTHASSQPIYEGRWQDYCYSLANCYENIQEEDLSYIGMTQRVQAGQGGYTYWIFNDIEDSDLFFKCLGGEFFFGDYYNEYLSSIMDFYQLTYDPRYQYLESIYYYEGLFPGEDYLADDWELTDDTPLYVRYLEVYSTFENVGSVDLGNIAYY